MDKPNYYDIAEDKLIVKQWLLKLAESRNMKYEERGNSVVLTFTENHKVITERKEPDNAKSTSKLPAKNNPGNRTEKVSKQ